MMTLLLARCGYFLPFDHFDSPISIKRDGNSFLFAICRDVTTGRIFASERNVSRDIERYRFLDASGRASISAGTVLSPESIPPSLAVDTAQKPEMLAGSEYLITIVSVDGKSGGMVSGFILREDQELPTDVWLHVDGSTTEEPCPAPE